MTSLKEFQEYVIWTAPPQVRDAIRKNFERSNAMSSEEREAFEREQRCKDRLDYVRARKDQQRTNCGLTGNQWRNRFKTFKLKGTIQEKNSQAEALRAARRFAEDWPNVQKGLAFYGFPGVGKDHLLHAIVNRILEYDRIYDIRYFYALDAERMIFDEIGQHSDEDTRIEQVMRESELLLLGDIHKVLRTPLPGRSDFAFKVFLRILNQVESTGKPILCITSNVTLADIDEDNLPNGSRLAGTCTWIEVLGPDRRRD